MQPRSTSPSDSCAALAPEQRFLLWILRAWVACCKSRALPAAPVESAFAEIGIAEAATALDEALRAVARSTLRPLAIHCPQCPGLSADENLLLQTIAAVQHREFQTAHRLLAGIVTPGAADRALGRLNSVGILMALAGLTLPEPETVEPISGGGALNPVRATLH